jgi:hypothetical protein
MQHTYASRLARAYLGASNPYRRAHADRSMTSAIPGDELSMEEYAPHLHGGPLHFINVSVAETISPQKQIQPHDRKGLPMAIGPCGLSVGVDSHALWSRPATVTSGLERLQALWEKNTRSIYPIPQTRLPAGSEGLAHSEVESLSVARWIAISGAAFSTGTGSQTATGLRVLLGLANIRFGYWWNSGVEPSRSTGTTRPTFMELVSRVMSRVLPVQTCLIQELFANFYGPARRHWHLSDGGYVENTGCYELIRRRVPFIICVDAGQDLGCEFEDLADLIRRARTDFGAEIQVARRRSDVRVDEAGARFPMPALEDLVHPDLLDVIGTEDDFPAYKKEDDSEQANGNRSKAHALMARLHYSDTDEFSWMLLIKPSVTGDEVADVLLYHRKHADFPHESATDQTCDQAQWESYRKLGEHIGAVLFTPPISAPTGVATWSPSQMCTPDFQPRNPPVTIAPIDASRLGKKSPATASGKTELSSGQ